MYNFNSPIGYSKRPLLYDNSDSSQSHTSTITIPNNKACLDSISLDIIIAISQFLDQASILNLLKTTKRLYKILKPRLYNTVIVDSSYSAFNKDLDLFLGTFINSTYNFKKLLINVNHKLIRHFKCIRLPDSVLIFDNDLNCKVEAFFKGCLQLTELCWLPDNFKLDNLRLLNHKPNLIGLTMNIKADIYSTNIQFNEIRNFIHLEQFLIKPYINRMFLRHIISNLNVTTLKSLLLNKYDKQLIEPKPHKLRVSNINDLADDITEIQDFNTIFTKKFHQLSHLALNGMILCHKDFDKFNSAINCSIITTLDLSNIIEYNFGDNQSILAKFKFVNLISLCIDIKQGYQDFVPLFLLNHQTLISLNLTIRINDTFPFNQDIYAIAINQLTSLSKLAIDIKYDKNLTHLNTAINLPTFDYFRSLPLKYIRFNSNDHQHNLELIKTLRSLEILHVTGLNAGGAPNFALGTNHPNVFDEWFKVQHVALIYLQHNKRLRKIQINQCMFECEGGTVVPRRK